MKIPAFLKSTRKEERGGLAMTLALIALFLALNLILVSLGGSLGFYMSIVDKAYYTLNGSTDEYFEAINPERKKIDFYFCQSEDSLNENYTFGRILDTLLQFEERYDYFNVSFLDVYYDYTLLAEYAEKHDTSIDADSVIMHCPATGESIVRSLSTFYIYDTEDQTNQDMVFNGEEIVATMLSRVLLSARPKAYFTTGHGEVSSTSMQGLLYSAGYDIVTADISLYDIEEDCELIVISAPKYDFEEYDSVNARSEISRLREFVSRGGTVLVLRTATSEALPRLDAFLSSYGMTPETGSLVRHEDMSVGSNSAAILLTYAQNNLPIGARAESKTSERVVFGASGALTLKESDAYRVSPLLESYDGAVLYRGGEEVSRGKYTVMAMSEIPTAEGGHGNVVLCTSSAIADGAILDMGSFGNEALLYSLLEYTGGEKTPIGCGVVVLNTYPLSNLTKNTSDRYFWLLGVALPLVTAGVGFVLLRRRKRR